MRNKKVYLNDKDAEFLLGKVNVNRKYRLNEEDAKRVADYKANKKLNNLGLENHEGQAIHSPYYWDKSDPKYSFFVKNPNFKPEDKEDFVSELLSTIKGHEPKYPKIKRQLQSEGHLLVVDPADIHIGKLARAFETGEEYNSQIAVQRVLDGVKGIIKKSNGFNIEKILFEYLEENEEITISKFCKIAIISRNKAQKIFIVLWFEKCNIYKYFFIGKYK